MAALMMAGSAHCEFENGGFSYTVLANGDLDARMWVVESRVPETPHPWFQLDTPWGVTYQGQALAPPTQDERGRVVFTLTLSPLTPNVRFTCTP